MYDVLHTKKKFVWGLLIGLIIVTTYMTFGIINYQFKEKLLVEVSDLMLYLLIFIVVIAMNFFNYIYIKIMLALFNIDRTDLMIWLYSLVGMLSLLSLQALSPNIWVKSFVKVIAFNVIFQQKTWAFNIIVLSGLVVAIDVLMTLLFQWR